ncbi:acetyl-CoA acetyltransferase [Candidatus Marsarchaeota G2 archaeon ECH_B_SAG-G16]|uniref:Acetyl-CoA acetyltransferase n=1 Tax=Candidatus Marsarchaeota G2 archaeon ECH_B_SAG-G16 TaxID=1978167 RepID=A0A2R6C000_9ARCH|nr:MAG: acetyl-CoA acetyltransferase [Candidatus Marsarchaeota G2 archaeon ECH_B_SAG-G16]
MISGFSGKVFKSYDGEAFEMLCEVVNEALECAHLEKSEIDGLVTTFLPGVVDGKIHKHFYTTQLAQFLGLMPRFMELFDYGGASAPAMLQRANKAVLNGEATNVLCVVGGKASDLKSKGVTVDSIDRLSADVSLTPFDEFFRVYTDMNPISDYALVATRHSHLFGTTDSQRALLAVKQRQNAKANELALYKNELSVSDVLSSPVVCEPLHLLEIVYPVDGFHAFIVSQKRTADLRAVDILAYGEAHWPEMPCELPDLVNTPAQESSKRARFDLSKIDAFELYDSFTITVMLQIEDIGLCNKGESGRFLERVDTTYKGELPINTGGGSLNTGQPAFMSGGVLIDEALRQLNYMAKAHQVSGVDKVFVNCIGGWNRAHSTTIVLGEAP